MYYCKRIEQRVSMILTLKVQSRKHSSALKKVLGMIRRRCTARLWLWTTWLVWLFCLAMSLGL